MQRKISLAFESADENKKGYLSKRDYKVAIIELFGYKPSKYEINSSWKEKAGDEETGLDLKAFTDLVLPRLQAQDSSEIIRQTFMAFDRFSRGFISLEDCKDAFAKVAPLIPCSRVESFFKEIDGDLDGRVTYRDFELMFKNLTILSSFSQ
ncbi:PREDICTED: EF-hand calcium-binding domain-containing protein 11-like [Amphimedon queenslandica]|uniref:EF-hand domain-containing protein n=1 Tax=Amphimedon queenslandica TaxID=400682 RepID=A0AAN0JRW1_AMPQE|nr:PREDICTED: EF-hand calcium-binding domain-containing protein 11-like [Amphimedon queenslandica]XP_019859592.1 PREDICTED: EF-hand calcium-binding domain-containing protein 11-like [Amphimedon queenslandica]|eukprot:XP_011407559.2 PREDICTED: EF-hand calcium-binding domain-containing protein 11-like [Amphimedon queenslandica]